MKTNYLPENDGSLHEVLRQWKLDTPLPPRFQEQVWQRIARAERKPRMSFWLHVMNVVDLALSRPKFAYSYVAILLVLGVTGGSWAAQKETSRLDAVLGSRYMQSVDTYQKIAWNQ